MAKERRRGTIGFPFETKQDNPGAAADQIVPALECLGVNRNIGPLLFIGAAPEFLIQVSSARDPGSLHWHVENLNDAMRVLQLKVPLFIRYSVVYQNVQSSTGSTLMLL